MRSSLEDYATMWKNRREEKVQKEKDRRYSHNYERVLDNNFVTQFKPTKLAQELEERVNAVKETKMMLKEEFYKLREKAAKLLKPILKKRLASIGLEIVPFDVFTQ